jgi:exonuclease VII small subunit
MLVVMCGGLAYGQAANEGGRGDRANRDRVVNATDWRQRMEQRVKENLGVTDEEWRVLQPKIEKVQSLQRSALAGRLGGFGGVAGRLPGGDNAAAANAPANPVADAMRELRAVLENKDASLEAVKQKLQAVRDAKKRAAEELTAAQNELRELLSVKQEAAAVAAGLLD